MAVRIRRFKAGDPHPEGVGYYFYKETEVESTISMVENNWKSVLSCATKEEFRSKTIASSGHRLENDAMIAVWEDEENEFGPISP